MTAYVICALAMILTVFMGYWNFVILATVWHRGFLLPLATVVASILWWSVLIIVAVGGKDLLLLLVILLWQKLASL
jgi:hypothetical protein